MNILAHAGEEHATETDSLVHMLKQNSWQILVVTAVFIGVAVLISSFTKEKAKPVKESKEDKEDIKSE